MNDFIENDAETSRLRERLKQAVRSEAAPPFLEARIRNTVRAERPVVSWTRRLVPAGAAALLFLGGAIAYQLGHLRLTTSSQESYIASVSNRVAALMRVGLGDHIHCAVFRKYPKDAPSVAQLVQKLGPAYSGLIPVVRRHVPDTYQMVIAHECRYHGRKFVHLSLKGDSRLLSLVITRKREGESFETEALLPAMVQAGIPLYRAGAHRFQLASFETRDHLVYFVSDLDQGRNTQMMAAMAAQVKEILHKIEG